MKKNMDLIKTILIIVGAVVAVAGIAFAVYRICAKKKEEELDEEFYFDDEDIAELLDEDDE